MTFTDITTPNWKMVGDMQKEIDELHAENTENPMEPGISIGTPTRREEVEVENS